jgi:hypothetical protein
VVTETKIVEYRSVGEIMKFTRCTSLLTATLGRHLDLDKTSREWTGGLGVLYKRKRETGGRRSLSSIRVGPCPLPATGRECALTVTAQIASDIWPEAAADDDRECDNERE